jgi:hypothetical protein
MPPLSYAYAVPFYGEPRPVLVDLIYSDNADTRSQYRYVEKKGDTLYAESAAPFLLAGQRTYIWATASPLRDDRGGIIGAIESIRDITERKEAEDALKDSERRMADIINFLPDATFVIDRHGVVIAWNRAIEAMTGIKAKQSWEKAAMNMLCPFTANAGRCWPIWCLSIRCNCPNTTSGAKRIGTQLGCMAAF